MKVIGRFAYPADLIPERSRTVRRDLLFGTMEHEVREISRAEAVEDAVVVSAYVSRSAALQRIGYLGFGGRLFRPLSHREEAEADRGPMTAEQLERLLRLPYPLSDGAQEMPLDFAWYDRFGVGPTRTDDALETRGEENFRGTVVATRKAEAVERYRRAAEDMLIVDGIVHARAFEPCWRFQKTPSDPGLHLRHFGYMDSYAVVFRLDRLAEIREFLGEAAARFPARGEIHAIDPAFLCRDDLSHHVNGALERLLGDRTAELVPFLSDAALAAWAELKRGFDRTTTSADMPYEGDLDRALGSLRLLRGEIETARFPAFSEGVKRDVLSAFRRFFERVEFEEARRPKPDISPEDEAVLGALGR